MTTCSRSPGPRPHHRCAAALAERPVAQCSPTPRAPRRAGGERGRRRRLRSLRNCSARAARGGTSSAGSALEANDALDEFLNLALDYERRETPSLQGFVAWLRERAAEVKRDMEIARDEVRVMTVHGAKGLEAPVVILADTMTPPPGPRPPRLLELAGGASDLGGTQGRRRAAASRPLATARSSEAEDEYRRLLYVAMTRAADRLIVCGADGRDQAAGSCWYDLVREPLEAASGRGRRRRRQSLALSQDADRRRCDHRRRLRLRTKSRRANLPAWLRRPAPTETPRAPPLSPSSAFDEEILLVATSAGSAADRQKALQRGRLVHRLMQSLPDIPAEPPQRMPPSAISPMPPRNFPGRTDRDGEASAGHPRRPELCRDLRAGKPRRGADRRPHRARDGADPIPVAGQVDRLAVDRRDEC